MGECEWEWLVDFRDSYARTYKRASADSRKNLRCFPQCGPKSFEHAEKVFCGRPVHVRVRLLVPLPLGAELGAWAEVVDCDQGDQWRTGCSISCADAAAKERSKANPLLPWIRADVRVEDDGSLLLTFNEQLNGWHYGWLSTKNTCNAQHCFRVYLFAIQHDFAFFITSASSSSFKVYTRHRKSAKAKALEANARKASAVDAGEAGAPLSDGSPSAAGPEPLAARASRAHDCAADSAMEKRRRSFGGDEADDVDDRADAIPALRPNEIPETRTLDRLVKFLFRHGHGRPDPPTPPPSPPQEGGSSPDGANEPDQYTAEADGAQPLERLVPMPVMVHRRDEEDLKTVLALLDDSRNDAFLEASTYHSFFPPNTPDSSNGSSTETESSASDGPNWHPKSGFAKLFKVLEADILASDPVLPADASETAMQQMRLLDRLAKAMFRLLSGPSESNNIFEDLAKQHATYSGLQRLQNTIQAESNLSFTWNRLFDDEEFDLTNPHLRERSLYAHVRHAFRVIVRESLQDIGLPASFFQRAMEVAARSHIISLDPFYPPAPASAAFLHMQIYGHQRNLKLNDYGSSAGRFRDGFQHEAFAKDLLLSRRMLFRRMLLQRVMATRILSRIPRGPAPRLPYEFDCSGKWESIGKNAVGLNLGEILAVVSGVKSGPMYQNLFDNMFNRIHIDVDSARLVFQGQRVLLAQPRIVAQLNCTPMTLHPPIPIPVDEMGAIARPRQVSAHLVTKPGAAGFAIHIAGLTVHESSAEMIQAAREKLQTLRSSSSPEKILQEMPHELHLKLLEHVASQPILDTDASDQPEVRFFHKFWRMGQDKLVVSRSSLFYTRSRDAPALDDEEGLRSSLISPKCFVVLRELARPYDRIVPQAPPEPPSEDATEKLRMDCVELALKTVGEPIRRGPAEPSPMPSSSASDAFTFPAS